MSTRRGGRRPLIAGNWKMHGTGADLPAIAAIAAHAHGVSGVDVLLCLPATLIERARGRSGTMALGGQDCDAAASGAHTGSISAAMLTDAGARYVIVGHSERRRDYGERDVDIAAKLMAAQAAGLTAIVCIGESEAERDAGATVERIATQLAGGVPDNADPARLVIAYEPVWAVGTGRVPTDAQIEAVHTMIRGAIGRRFGATGDAIRILYGGSMSSDNAAQILAIPDVDGGLVGRDSLTPARFARIIDAAAGAAAAAA